MTPPFLTSPVPRATSDDDDDEARVLDMYPHFGSPPETFSMANHRKGTLRKREDRDAIFRLHLRRAQNTQSSMQRHLPSTKLKHRFHKFLPKYVELACRSTFLFLLTYLLTSTMLSGHSCVERTVLISLVV